MYKLKPTSPDFELCDGPFARRKFLSGKVYQDIPPTEAHRFDEVALEETGWVIVPPAVPAEEPGIEEPAAVPDDMTEQPQAAQED
jgi:hypothetical protein